MRPSGSGLAAVAVLFLAFARVAIAQEAPPDAAVGAAEAVGPPTISDFTAKPLISDLALAPSGNFLAYVQRRDADSLLVVKDLRTPDAKPTAMKLGPVIVYGLKWMSDDRLVYSAGAEDIGVDFKRGKIVLTGVPRLLAVDRDFKNTVIFFQGEKKIENANIITTSDINLIAGDSENFVVPLRVGRNLDLVRVNVRDGKWTTAARGEERTIAWFLNRDGEPAMRFDTNWRYSEIRVMLPERNKKGELNWKQSFVVRFDRNRENAADFTPIAPGPEPKLYYILARPAGADRTGVYLYNLETQTYVSEVFSDKRVDVARGMVDPLTGEYVGAAYWNDMLEMTFVDKKMQAHFSGLKEFFGRERNVAFVDTSTDHRVWVLFTSGPRDPGSYHVYDMEKAVSDVIGATNLKLSQERLGKSQVITYAARDGMEMTGYLTSPPGSAPGAKPPLIVYPHGGPEARSTQSYNAVAQFLATRGYAVFQPNFRGSSGYGKAFAEAGHGKFGSAMQTDIYDGVEKLIAQGLVDPARICILGESYGGYAALIGVVQFPETYRCAVSAAGVSDLYRQLRWEEREEGGNSEAYKYWVAQIGDPGRDKARIEAASPINNLSAIRAPVMLMHGKQDDTVPFEQSDLMHQAMTKAGKQAKFVIFENAGHNLLGANLEEYLGQLEQFFAKNMPPAARPSEAPAN